MKKRPFVVALAGLALLATVVAGPTQSASAAASFVITTTAGTGTAGFSGDGGAATGAQLNNPYGVVVDAEGNFFIADRANHRVRKIDTSGNISTVVGTGTGGYSGDGGAAPSAQLNSPVGVALDAQGNLFIADRNNHRVRKVDMAGNISTVAGTGTAGYSGDGGAATSAQLNLPQDIALDVQGNLLIPDGFNHRVRKIDTSGNISTVAGTGTQGYSGDGGAAASAQLNTPVSVALDAQGNLFIAEHGSHRVRRIDTSGNISTVAGTGTAGSSGDGGTATSAQLFNPFAVIVDAQGNLFIADSTNHRVRRIDTSGNISTVAGIGTAGSSGDGGAATSAQLNASSKLAIDTKGNLFISELSGHRIRKVALIAPATASSRVAAAVDPTLTFVVAGHSGSCNGVPQSAGATSSGTAVGLGRINSANGVGAQDLTVSTNGASGFTVFASADAFSNGSGYSMPAVPGSNATPAPFPAFGTAAFGITTSDATLGTGSTNRFTSAGAQWAALTTLNGEVSYNSGPVTNNTECVAYQAAVGPTTPAGAYSTTVIYTAAAAY